MSYTLKKVLNKDINDGWLDFFNNPTTLNKLNSILKVVNNETKNVFPLPNRVLRTFNYFHPKDTKLVVIGQDPYINFETIDDKIVPQACGMSFSVPRSYKVIPPSLKNIFIELKNSVPNYKKPDHGSLLKWVKNENTLLLNSALTVTEGKSNSHQTLWQDFTDDLIKWLSDNNDSTVFLLMGRHAQNKSVLIDSKHKIFKTVHPSPLSASKGFFGCNVFNEINEYYESIGTDPIHW
jgi:uracil-DNA glycosylase